MPMWVSIAYAGYGAISTYMQAQSAKQAGLLQAGASKEALAEASRQFDASQAFAEKQWATTQAQLAPFIAAGQGGVSKLSHLLGVSGVSPGMGAQSFGGGTGTGGKTDPGGGKNRFTDDPNYSGAYQGIDPDSGVGQANAITAGLPTAYATTTDSTTPADARRSARLWNIQQTSGSPNPQNPTYYRGPDTTPPRSAKGPTTDRFVPMTAPDGTTQDVPEELADYYALRGARVASNA